MSKIIQLYSDKDKKIKAYPKTLASQVYMDDGTTTINSHLETKANKDDFIAKGGVYGIVTDEQAIKNASILQDLIDEKNAIILDYENYCKYTLYTLNMSLTLKDYSIIKNVRLSCKYTEAKDYSIGLTTSSRNIKLENMYLYNAYNDESSVTKCPFGIKFADGNSLYSSYCNIDNVEFANYKHPIFLFTWNCLIGRIKFNNCTTTGIFIGTSININSYYSARGEDGLWLGKIPNDVCETPKNEYLDYSKIGILSQDTTTNKMLTLGKIKGIVIDEIATETANSTKDIIHIEARIERTSLIVNKLLVIGEISGYVLVNNTQNISHVIINSIQSYYLTNKLIRDNTIKLTTNVNDNYPFSNDISSSKCDVNTVNLFGNGVNSVIFQGEVSSYGGTTSTVKQFNSYSNYVGTLNKNESLEVIAYNANKSIQSNTGLRNFNLFVKMDISEFASYQTANAKAMDTIYINLIVDTHTLNTDYTSRLTVKSIFGDHSKFNISVKSSEDYPVIVITPSTNSTSTNVINYIYAMQVLGGNTQQVKLITNS